MLIDGPGWWLTRAGIAGISPCNVGRRREEGKVREDWEPEDIVAAWTLVDDDWELVVNKSGVTRLGFALLAKLLEQVATLPLGARSGEMRPPRMRAGPAGGGDDRVPQEGRRALVNSRGGSGELGRVPDSQDQLAPGGNAELGVDVLQVVFDGVHAHE